MKTNRKFSRIIGVGLSVAMLATTVLTAVPVMALTSATVTTTNNTVGASGQWDIRFTVNTAITTNGTDGGNITITFPSGFTVAQSTTNISNLTVAAGPGWLNQTTFGDAIVNNVTSNSTAATRRLRISLNSTDVIGADAQVRIIIPAGSITNPSNAGTYNITVATSNETTAVASANFVITLPFIGPLPGQVEGKNSNGDVLYRNIVSDLSAVIATPGVSRIELSSGTYNFTNAASVVNQTIVGVGASGTVILTGVGGTAVPLTISGYGVVLDSVTITGNPDGTANLLSVTANATIRNVTFNGGVTQLAAGASAVVTVENCRFNVTGNVSTGLTTANSTRVTGTTFTVDSSGTGISTTGNLTLNNSTFSGTGTSTGVSVGTGADVSTNSTEIIQNTFTGLRQALTLGNENVTVRGNTISSGGESTASDTRGVVTVSNGMHLLIDNTISNSNAAYYAIHVSGGNLTARFNNITGNTLNVRQTGGTANATLNWWGSSTGPASSTLNATTAASLITSPYLSGSVSNGVIGFSTSNLTARNTAGVELTTANGTLNYAGAARYAANPQAFAPPGSPIAYYDVALGVTPGAEPGSVTIRFYGAVTADTLVYYGGGLSGAWSLASSQGVNTAIGYAYVTITASSSPAYSDMGGTPFVLINIVAPPAAPTLLGPAAGTTGVPVNTGFSWSPVTGATSYNFQVSTVSTFATTVSVQTGLTSTVAGGLALTANTTYFWRVQGVNSGGASAWSASTFTTAAPAAPVVTAPPAVTVNVTPQAPVINVAPPAVTVQPPNVTVNPPQVTVSPPPPAQITVNPPQVTVSPPPPAQVTVTNTPPAPVIPTYILWTIILIGAVLVIALIVLIVRTRRVA